MATKRIFPGPAGLVHESECSTVAKRVKHAGIDAEEEKSGSGDTVEVFEGRAWRRMLELVHKLESQSLKQHLRIRFSTITIKWIQEHALTILKDKKIPFLSGVLSKVDDLMKKSCRSLAQCAEWRDETGAMDVMLDSDFVGAFGQRILPGATVAVAIRNVGILRLKHKFVLTLLLRNVVFITGLGSMSKEKFVTDEYKTREDVVRQIELDFHKLIIAA